MTDSDKRLTELETLVSEIPNLLNTRFARFETEFVSVRGAIADNTARFASLERTIIALQTDMRDLRGGVTRQLVEQDKRLGGIEERLERQDRRLGAIEERLEGQDRRLGAIEERLEGQDLRLGAIEERLEGQNRRLATLEGDVAAIKAAVAEVLSRLPRS